MFRMDEAQLNALLEQNPSLSISKNSGSHIALDSKAEANASKITESEPSKKDGQNKYRNYPVFLYQDGYVYDSSVQRSTRREIGAEKTRLESVHGKLKAKFDSKKEFIRFLELSIMEKNGAIQGLKRQVPLLIQPAVEYQGERLLPITYCADFVYTDTASGETVVEDVKGYDKKRDIWLTTQTFQLKWKLLKAKYPSYVFKLV